MLRLVILTSGERRHNFFVNTLAERLRVVGVVQETKGALPGAMHEDESDIFRRHFSERDKSEMEYFGTHDQIVLQQDVQLRLERGHVNDPDVCAWIETKDPDYLILFGTGIVKDPILSKFESRVINIHLGLSPYYRGSGTNFWPLVDGLPECVGATIHLATLDVDGGPVLTQVRPEVMPSDRNHDMGCKTIIAGAHAMVRAIENYDAKTITPKPQVPGEGKVFRKKDVTAEAIKRMWDNLDRGMISEYCANKIARDGAYPIIK